MDQLTEEDRARLFSEPLIAAYVDSDRRFVERPWLTDLVEAELAYPNCRFLLLTGEPGAGKTALMAWKARHAPSSPRYFIRRDSQNPLNGGDARSLLFALGHQLAAIHPGMFHPDKLKVVVRQRLRKVTAGGRATGISVDELRVSPFYRTALQVEQEVGLVEGDVAGIAARRLIVEERLLEISNLQFVALLDPLEVLRARAPKTRVVILVDALDEIRYQSIGDSIVDWLAACPELPDNVRFVLSSRPDARLLDLFRQRQRSWLREAVIDAHRDELDGDLRRYATTFAGTPAVAQALAASHASAAQWVGRAVAKAEGNFQYLSALFRAIEQAIAVAGDRPRTGPDGDDEVHRLLDFDGVPAGLGAIYSLFLSLMRTAVSADRVTRFDPGSLEDERLPAWEGLYQPLLGVLAVAREPLRPDQIAQYGGVDVEERWVVGAFARLAQFLTMSAGVISLYHASFADYLTDDATRQTHPDDYLNPNEWHAKVAARATAQCGDDWTSCRDQYAIDHAVEHLATAIVDVDGPRREALVDRMVGILTDVAYLEAKAARPTGSANAPRSAPPIDTTLEEIRLGAGLVPTEVRLQDVLRVVDRQAHNFRGPELAESPAYFAQQLHNQAVELDVDFLVAGAKKRLAQVNAPHLELRWQATVEATELERTLMGQQDLSTPIAVDATGRVLTALKDHSVLVWDVETGRELSVLRGHRASVRALAFMPDGRTAVSCGDDKTVRVWDLDEGKARSVLKGHADEVRCLAVAPDGKRVITGSLDQALIVWDIADGRVLRTFRGHRDPVGAVLIGKGGVVVSGPLYSSQLYFPGNNQDDPVLRVWDLDSGRPIRRLKDREVYENRFMALTPDGRFALGSGTGAVRVWEIETGGLHQVIRLPVDSWISMQRQPVAVANDGSWAVAASIEYTLEVFDPETGRVKRSLEGHEGEVLALAVTPDNERVLSSSKDGTIRVWDVAHGREMTRLTGHAAWICSLVAIDDHRAISASDDGVVMVWNLDATTDLGRRTGHRGRVRSVALDRDARRAASGSDDGTAKVWDVATGAELGVFRGGVTTYEQMGESVSSVDLAPDGRRAVAAASSHGIMKIWNVARRRQEHVVRGDIEEDSGYPYPVEVAIVSPDGRRVLSAWGSDYGEVLRVHALTTANEEFTVLGRRPELLGVAETAPIVVWQGKSDALEAWDLVAKSKVSTFARSSRCEGDVAITPDGRIAVAGFGGVGIGVWEVASGQQLLLLPEGVRPSPTSWSASQVVHFVTRVAIDPDGRRGLSASEDGLVRVWDFDTSRLVATLGDPAHPLDVAAVTKDFRRLAATGPDGTVAVFDLDRGIQVASTYLHAAGTAIRIADDGMTVFVGDRAGGVYSFRITS